MRQSPFGLMNSPGCRHSRTVPAQFRVIRSETEAVEGHQYRGDLWGFYLLVEEPDGAFLKTHALEDGNIYRIANSEGDRKHRAESQPDDKSDYAEFKAKVAANPPEAWWRANLDLPAFYSFHALNLQLGNVDLREADNHYLYHGRDGRWTVLPWDLDMMFIPKSHQSGRVEEDRCLEIPALRLEYRNRCRELLDLLCSDPAPDGGQFGQIVDEYSALLHPPGEALAWPELDAARWNFDHHTSDQGAFYRNPTAGGPEGNWTRRLASADFAGFARFVTEYATAARPADRPWHRDDGDARGYGYGFLMSEAADPEVPERPSLEYTGKPGFPRADLRFSCSPYQGKAPFAAMQWRLGEIAGPGRGLWKPGDPRRYEIEELWSSPELREFTSELLFPVSALTAGHAYRARVRVKDAAGCWSHWSEPGTFMAGE